MQLTRDAILAATDLQLTTVTVPEWGGDVFVRPMSGTERDSLEAESIALPENRRMENFRARMVARTVCDADGKRLFSDTDVAALGGKSAAALDRVFQVVQKLSRYGDAEVTDLGNASSGDPSAGSGSGSR